MTLSRILRIVPILTLLVSAWGGPCGAQALDHKSKAKMRPQTVPEDTRPGRSGSLQEPLGKKLDRTDGVIHPPQGVDPGVTIPPPLTGSSMPVIPPPGTPGGNPAIEPK